MYKVKLALTDNLVHVLMGTDGNASDIHGIYSMPINTFQSFTGITVRMIARGLLDYQVDDKFWKHAPLPEMLKGFFRGHSSVNNGDVTVAHRMMDNGIAVAGVNPNETGFIWLVMFDHPAQGVAPENTRNSAKRMIDLMAMSIIQLGPYLANNFNGELNAREWFPGMFAGRPIFEWSSEVLAQRIGYDNNGWAHMDQWGSVAEERINPEYADRPLKDIVVFLSKLGMNEGDAVELATNLGKAGLSSGNALHAEVISSVRDFLAAKLNNN